MKNRHRKRFVNNRRVVNPLRIDPTRTTLLRKQFVARLRRQFARLGLAMYDLIVKEDALGLRERRRTIAQLVVGNAFCPTGEGGGIDNSCSPNSSTGSLSSSASVDDLRKTNGGVGSMYDVEGFHDKILVPMHNKNDYDSLRKFKEKRPKTFERLRTASLFQMYKDHPTSDTFAEFLDKPITLYRGMFQGRDTGGTAWTTSERVAQAFADYGPRRSWESDKFPGGKVKTREVKPKDLLFYSNAQGETESITYNVFCPTGEGGGVDPTCSPSVSAGSIVSYENKEVYRSGDVREASGGHTAIGTGTYFGPTKDTVAGYGSSVSSHKLPPGKYLKVKGDRDLDQVRSEAKEWAEGKIQENIKSEKIDGKLIGDLAHPASQLTKYLQSKGIKGIHYTVDDPKRDHHEQFVVFNSLATNQRWRFETDPEKLKQFQAWLRRQLKLTVLSTTDEELWERYVQEGYKKGAGRAFDDVRVAERARYGAADKLDFYQGSREQFLRSAFGRPESAAKVKLIAERAYDELEGMTNDMSLKLGRALADGLTRGENPIEIARGLSKQLGLSRNRAEVIARTEIIRAHAEGQLNAMSDLGVEEIGVMVEWSTAGDDRVCDLCSPMEGVVLRIEEAKGMIPRHPNCRCAFVPANVGESTAEQTRGKARVERAVRESAERANSDGFDTNVPVSRNRPKSVLS